MHRSPSISDGSFRVSGRDHAHSHSGHRHHHHHHHHSRRLANRAGIAFALAACLLLGWSLIPLASVGFFETRLVAIGTWLLVAFACFLPRDGGPLPSGRAWCFIAVALALWCGIQLLPVPSGLPAFWCGDSAVFAQIATHAAGRLRMAVVPYLAFHTGLHWAGLFALACVAAHRLRTKTALRVLLAGFVLGALLEGFFSLFHNIGPSVRLRGTFANPDAFGGLLAMTLPLTAALLLDRIAANAATPSASFSHRGAATRIAWMTTIATAFFFQLVVLFFTGSRGATASASLALMVLLAWCWTAFPARRKVFLGGLLLLLCLAPVFFIHAQRLNVWERTLDPEGELDTGIATRRRIWETGLALVRDFPCGTGPGGTAQALPIYQTDAHGRYRLDYAHNDTLQFLGDLGWPGGVLLLCGLLLLVRQGLRAVKAPETGNTPLPWLERGIALALLASLVHSQAEFNLSARPPVQLMFAILAGALFAVPRDESRHGHGHSSSSHRPAWLLRAPVLLAAAASIVLSLRAAIAYRDARAAAQAAGLATPATDSPLLLPAARTLPIPPNDPAMLRAARWGLQSPFVRSVLASLPLSNHRHAVLLTAQAQAEAIREREDAEDASDDADGSNGSTLWLPSPVWDDADADMASDDTDLATLTPELMSQATLALRFEEAQAVRDALPHADAALRLAPWSSQAMTDRAWLLLRATALRALPADALARASAEAHADLDLAATLFPSDAYTLSDICAALSAEEKNDENFPRILGLAERAFALNPFAALSSMDRWWRVGIPIHPLVQIEDLPVTALQKLYGRALYTGDNAEADSILSLIELRTRPDAPLPPAASRWSPARLAKWQKRQTPTHLWALRHRLRQNLLAGDWGAVAASAPTRSEARILRFRAKFNALSSSPMLRRLQLREWSNRNILPLYWRIEWALAECAAGKNPELYRDIWAEAARHPPLPPEQANRLPPRVRADFPSLANPAPVPPDSASATSAPEASLELSYLGERLFLESAAIETPAPPGKAPRLLLAWRFEAPPTPPNLNFRIRLRDENNTLLFHRTCYFEKSMPGYYQGRPEPGSRHVFAIPLPPAANFAKTLSVDLRDGKTSIFQDDIGKAILRLSCSALPRVAPPPPALPATVAD